MGSVGLSCCAGRRGRLDEGWGPAMLLYQAGGRPKTRGREVVKLDEDSGGGGLGGSRARRRYEIGDWEALRELLVGAGAAVQETAASTRAAAIRLGSGIKRGEFAGVCLVPSVDRGQGG